MTLIAPPPAPGSEPDPSASGPDADLPTHGPDAASPALGSAAAPPARLDREDAERLGLRIQHQAAVIAQATCEFLLMLAEFDAREGVRFYEGLKSTAHWLGWACSMAAGTAREHLRVARALPELPLTVAEFGAGRLSYSKVREITRVVGRVEEEVLVEMARAMTAAQLSRTISSFRAVDGSRLDQESRREARWHVREDGMVEIRAVLPAETGAELLTALDLALGRDGTSPPTSTALPSSTEPVAIAERCAEITAEATLEQRRADALHDIARTYLAAEPDDRSGEDRHLVVVQVSAESLVEDVPAGTLPRCGVVGGGPLEPRTAERLACTGKVSLAISDVHGEILHLGRARRLASRAQRRALRLRDGTCVFPGCHQSKHLDAHHLTPWSEGGPTDLDELALLCRRHHVMVHEGGLRLVHSRSASSGSRAQPAASRELAPSAVSSAAASTGATAAPSAWTPRFQVLDEAGRPVQARWPAMLERLILRPDVPTDDTAPCTEGGAGAAAADEAEGDGPVGEDHSTTAGRAPGTPDGQDPERIAATTGGEGFCLADCVQALCESVLVRAA
ncbi:MULTISPECIES: HNH endonuclease signature motif containing protein [Brachybacterium]|uniref:HNH endonuclease n=1 Tax=Brachybacterium conglomeratum TaxID=47846 RepID=A0ABQ5RCZ2_9MICO|nr:MULTISPECIES: HNH endonuclease signature motif containing protein [Brachybacterium]GLI29477.1 HNH endonuclease [Brachybacterium conglomeratum]GLK06116.1 HNH endonuclease [Brachybacterium conglomeratum]